MSEQYSEDDVVVRPISDESFDIAEGPVRFALSGDEFVVAVPGRDVGDGWNVDCTVVATSYHAGTAGGYKGLRDGEQFMLGRSSAYANRFDPSLENLPGISREHVMISRKGTLVRFQDLGSTNGTHLIARLTAGSSQSEQAGRGQFADEVSQSIGLFEPVLPDGTDQAEKAASMARTSLNMLRAIPFVFPRSLGMNALRGTVEKVYEAAEAAGEKSGSVMHGVVAKAFEDRDGVPYVGLAYAQGSRAHLFRQGSLQRLTAETPAPAVSVTDSLEAVFIDDPENDKTIAIAGSETSSRPTIEPPQFNNGETASSSTIHVSETSTQASDKVLIASDEVHLNLSDDEIVELMSAHNTAGATVTALIKAAQARRRQNMSDAATTGMNAVVLAV